jgi:hypothetical protein
VSDQPGPAVDAGAIVAALQRQQVAFVAVGGMAAIWHGSVRITKDFDLCPRWTPENLQRLALALEELDARLLVPDGPTEGIEVPLDGRFLAAMELSTRRTTAGDVDVLLGIPADRRWRLSRFEHLQQRAIIFELEGARVMLASLADIVRSKEVSDRPPDREALPDLQNLLERQRSSTSRPPARSELPKPRRPPPRAGR